MADGQSVAGACLGVANLRKMREMKNLLSRNFISFMLHRIHSGPTAALAT